MNPPLVYRLFFVCVCVFKIITVHFYFEHDRNLNGVSCFNNLCVQFSRFLGSWLIQGLLRLILFLVDGSRHAADLRCPTFDSCSTYPVGWTKTD